MDTPHEWRVDPDKARRAIEELASADAEPREIAWLLGDIMTIAREETPPNAALVCIVALYGKGDDFTAPMVDEARTLLEDLGVEGPPSGRRAHRDWVASLPPFERLLEEVDDLLRANEGPRDQLVASAARKLREAEAMRALPTKYARLLATLAS